MRWADVSDAMGRRLPGVDVPGVDAMGRRLRLRPGPAVSGLGPRDLTLDHSPQAPYAQAHQRGLQCEGSDIGVFSLSIAQEAPLIPIDRNFTSQLFSDQV